MSLYNSINTVLQAYMEELSNHPVRTMSITSSVLAASATYTSQRIAGVKKINVGSVIAYAIFGLIFGATVPHFFYQMMELLIRRDMIFRSFFQFLFERILFTPFHQVLSLYFISIFELNTHQVAVGHLKKLYWPLIKANWIYLSIPNFLNIAYVPPMLRTVTRNIIIFFWVVYIAERRRSVQEKQDKQRLQK